MVHSCIRLLIFIQHGINIHVTSFPSRILSYQVFHVLLSCPSPLAAKHFCMSCRKVVQTYIKKKTILEVSVTYGKWTYRHWQTNCPPVFRFAIAFSLILEWFWQKRTVNTWSFESSCQNNALPSQSGNLIFVRYCVSMNKDFFSVRTLRLCSSHLSE